MEQHDVEIGTRRDLVLYRIETSKNDLKSGAHPPAAGKRRSCWSSCRTSFRKRRRCGWNTRS